MDIKKYEVILELHNPNTGDKREITRLEHAYSAIDAVTQGIMNVSKEAGSAEIKVQHVGPPTEDIIKFNEMMDRLKNVVTGRR